MANINDLKFSHIYLRGNYQQDMFYDKLDKINVWNRLWLSAAATNTKILSAVFLDNHFHLTIILTRENQASDFMHHFRMSITAYHNRHYSNHGTLGTRDFNRSTLKGPDDAKDCICYHLRNVLHHHVQDNYLAYRFSTVRYIFGLQSDDQLPEYTRETLSRKMSRAFLPSRVTLPEGWSMNRDHMIIPPKKYFPQDILEAMFSTRTAYLATLSRRTRREKDDCEIPTLAPAVADLRQVPNKDEQLSMFVLENCRIPIPSMTTAQKMKAVFMIIDRYPDTNLRLLSRLFGIPYSTLRYRIRIWRTRS